MKRRGNLSPIILIVLCAIMMAVLPLVARYQHWRHDLKKASCEVELQKIQLAKDWLAEETGASPKDKPRPTQLRPYLKKARASVTPVCPDGGTITVGSIGTFPTCDFSLRVAGHKIVHVMTTRMPE